MEKSVSDEKLHRKACKLISQLVSQNGIEDLENTLQDLNRNCNNYSGAKLKYWRLCAKLLLVEIEQIKRENVKKEESTNNDETTNFNKSIPSYIITKNDFDSVKHEKSVDGIHIKTESAKESFIKDERNFLTPTEPNIIDNIKRKVEPSSNSLENGNRSVENKRKAEKLNLEAKKLAAEGNIREAYGLFEKANLIFPNEKFRKRMNKLEPLIAELSVEENEEVEAENERSMNRDASELQISEKISRKLYTHQFVGVQWLHKLYRNNMKGGILADDMGLGKTVQIVAFVSSMMRQKKINHVLLVLPKSLVSNWQEEFDKWAPEVVVLLYCSGTDNQMKNALRNAKRQQSVLVTTYGICQSRGEAILSNFKWDYTILDEGHRIKNPSKTTKALHSIPSHNRIILTGTPLQNKLIDLWSLLDYTTQGTILGSKKTFITEYQYPIENARKRGAGPTTISHGNFKAQSLWSVTNPYILRRTKDSVTKEAKHKTQQQNQDGSGDAMKHALFPTLNKKNDLVCWCYTSEVQNKLYTDFMSLPQVQELLNSKKSPLVQLNVLKKICDHPRLLSKRACIELGFITGDNIDDNELDSCAANDIEHVSVDKLMQESGKVQFVIDLLELLRRKGHRTALFSSSRKILNIIHKILLVKNFKIMRLDGRVTKVTDRQMRVNKFQTDDSYNVFLLTIQVGGVGLTLTGADRAIIFDPGWNPSTDNQAVDRIYRIGQEKEVVVYRLITCGTVEEAVYRKQVYKSSIIRQTVEKSEDPFRYFKNEELKDLFKLEDTSFSKTQMQLEQEHSHQRDWSNYVVNHVDEIKKLRLFGISDNGLMFSKKADDFEATSEQEKQQIMFQVTAAQMKMQQESQMSLGMNERWGGFKTKQPATTDKKKIDNKEPIYEIDGLEIYGSTKVLPEKFSEKYPSIVIDDDETTNDKTANLSQLKIGESINISEVSSKKLQSDVIGESILIEDSDNESMSKSIEKSIPTVDLTLDDDDESMIKPTRGNKRVLESDDEEKDEDISKMDISIKSLSLDDKKKMKSGESFMDTSRQSGDLKFESNSPQQNFVTASSSFNKKDIDETVEMIVDDEVKPDLHSSLQNSYKLDSDASNIKYEDTKIHTTVENESYSGTPLKSNVNQSMESVNDVIKPVMSSSLIKSPVNMQSTPNDPKIRQENKFKDLNTTPIHTELSTSNFKTSQTPSKNADEVMSLEKSSKFVKSFLSPSSGSSVGSSPQKNPESFSHSNNEGGFHGSLLHDFMMTSGPIEESSNDKTQFASHDFDSDEEQDFIDLDEEEVPNSQHKMAVRSYQNFSDSEDESGEKTTDDILARAMKSTIYSDGDETHMSDYFDF